MIYLLYFQAKRPRVLSESENGSEDPVKEPPASNNGYGFGGMPSPDVVQTRLELLQKSFPNKVRMCCVCISFSVTFLLKSDLNTRLIIEAQIMAQKNIIFKRERTYTKHAVRDHALITFVFVITFEWVCCCFAVVPTQK